MRPYSENQVTDLHADLYLWVALGIFGLSIVFRPLAMLFSLILVARLVWMCNLKLMPALLLLMFDRGNISIFSESTMALRLGITVTPWAMLVIVAFLFVCVRVMCGSYDAKSIAFVPFWIAMLIPASIMSFTAKAQGLSGIWSGPIMDSLIPSVYFWGISMAPTFLEGRDYFFKRLIVIICIINFLTIGHVIKIYSSWIQAMSLVLMLYVIVCNPRGYPRAFAVIGCLGALLALLFSKYFNVKEIEGFAGRQELGSTFNQMATFIVAGFLAITAGRLLGRAMLHFFVMAAIIVSFAFVGYVIQWRTTALDTEVGQMLDIRSFSERFKWKLLGDRGGVWAMGWQDATTPPYFIRDMRMHYVIGPDKSYMKLLPHNQVITLLDRDGWWLGLTEVLFLFWVLFRTVGAVTYCYDDKLIRNVLMPVFISVFFVIGVTGQTVYSSALWGNALVTLTFPGIVYGHMCLRKNYMLLRNYHLSSTR